MVFQSMVDSGAPNSIECPTIVTEKVTTNHKAHDVVFALHVVIFVPPL